MTTVSKKQAEKNSVSLNKAVNKAEYALVEKRINVSSEKKDLMQKNITARFKTCETFKNASSESIALIIKHSDDATLEYLLNASNYKTATRILDASKMLCNEKHSSIIDYTLSAVKRSSLQKTSVDMICSSANQCYSRVSNAIKALYFFNLIAIDNATTNKRLIVRMSKESLISEVKQA